MNARVVVLGQFPGNSRIRVVQIAVEPGAAGAIVHAGRIGLAIGGAAGLSHGRAGITMCYGLLFGMIIGVIIGTVIKKVKEKE